MRVSLPSLELALTLSCELGQRADEVMALSHLGDAMEAMRQYEAACAYKEDAIRIAREIGDVQADAEVTTDLSRIHLWLDDRSKAEQLVKNAICPAHEHGLRVEEADSWQELGMTYLATKHWDSAAEAFSTALPLFEEVGLEQKCREVYCELAWTTEQAGDHLRAAEFLRCLVPELNLENLLSLADPSVCSSCYL